jgi:triacylglycerol lipase
MLPAALLVPGWSDTARRLSHARLFLLAAGWPETHVRCVEFRERHGSNVEHAEEIAAAVEELRRASGEAAVAVIAHSMGGLALRRYLATHPAPAVHTAIFAGTPHRGTWLAYLARGRGGTEMRPGSRFLRELAQQQVPGGVRAVCIRALIDTRVVPGRSALLDGASCHTIGLASHRRLLRHQAALRLIRDLLLERIE